MVKSEIVECKLPKGRKWSDKEVIKETSPYRARYGGQLYCSHGKHCYFYPIGEDLYIKGMFSKADKGKQEIVNIPIKLTNYKNLTGIEAWTLLSEQVLTESMVLNVWKGRNLAVSLHCKI